MSRIYQALEGVIWNELIFLAMVPQAFHFRVWVLLFEISCNLQGNQQNNQPVCTYVKNRKSER